MKKIGISKRNLSLKKSIFLIIVLFLFSCGGGGGGETDAGNSPSYYTWQQFHSSNDYANQQSISLNFVDTSSAINFRFSEGNMCTFASPSANLRTIPETSSSYRVELGFPAQSGEGDCSGANLSGELLSISTNNLSEPNIFDLGGIYSGSLERIYDWDFGIIDTNNQTQTVFQVNSLGNETDGVLSYWSGTSYVAPEVTVLNYGDTCTYSEGVCLDLDADTSLDTDLIASVSGDETLLTDMPDYSQKTYTSKALAVGLYGVLDWMGVTGISSFNGNCTDANVGTFDCQAKAVYSVSGAHSLVANFTTNTLTGSFSLSNHLQLEFNEQDLTPAFPPNVLENLTINATITGNGFEGTVSNTELTGGIFGHFYGPEASEIGATMIIFTDLELAEQSSADNPFYTVISLAGY